MSAITPTQQSPQTRLRERRAKLNRFDFRANRALKWLAIGGASLIFIVMLLIAYQIISGASLAIGQYGLAFLFESRWAPLAKPIPQMGGAAFIYGTLITSGIALIASTVIGVSIGIFLSMLAPRRIAAVIGPLVEMLAAIPSIVIGLIGIELICPVIKNTIAPALHSVLGFIPLFGPPQPVGNSLFAAAFVLTIMVVPIISALTRDIFLTVPQELKDGAEALGATRWEMIRGVVIPTTLSGITAACVLGFGRAIGEAIAVAQVIGGTPVINVNLFKEGAALASTLATNFESPPNALGESAYYYMALILLVFGICTNLLSRAIAKRGAKVA